MHLDSSEYHRTGGVGDMPSLVNELPCGNNVLEDGHVRACTLCQGNQLEVAEEITGSGCCQGCQICRIEDAEEVVNGKRLRLAVAVHNVGDRFRQLENCLDVGVTVTCIPRPYDALDDAVQVPQVAQRRLTL